MFPVGEEECCWCIGRPLHAGQSPSCQGQWGTEVHCYQMALRRWGCSWWVEGEGVQPEGVGQRHSGVQFYLPLIVTTHSVGPGGGALVIFTGLCVGGTGVGAMDVATMGMAIVPIFEPLEWGRGDLRHALGGIIATAAVEGHAAALIVSTTTTIASLESISTAVIVCATTAAAWLSLLGTVLLLAMPTAARLTILVVLLWVLKHAIRGENPLSLTMDRPWRARRGTNVNTTNKCRPGAHQAPINILGIDYHQYCSSSYLEYHYHCDFVRPWPGLQQIHLKNKQFNDAQRDHSPI
jgi:hypothetical protein